MPRDLSPSRPIQIYMKPGIQEDALMLKVWDACRRMHRPQDVFRAMLRAGLIAMVESGEMPDSVVEECGLESLVVKRRRRINAAAPVAVPTAFPYPFPAVFSTAPAEPTQAAATAAPEAQQPAAPAETPAPQPSQVKAEATPSSAALSANRPSVGEDGKGDEGKTKNPSKPERKIGKLM